MRLTALLFFCTLVFLAKSNAQIGGTATYKFLDLITAAHVTALGGNNISLYDNELDLIAYNPSLLKDKSDNAMSINYVSYFADINWGYTAYAKHFNKIGNLALAMQYVNYGTFLRTDILGNKLGNFKAAEYAMNLVWSKNIDSMWRIGANLKPIYSKLENLYSIGIACDLGINYYKQNDNFSAAFVIRNIGTQIKPYYSQNYEKIPIDIQLGLTKKLKHAPFRISLTAQHLQKPRLDYKITADSEPVITEETKITKLDVFKKYTDLTFRHAIFGIEFMPSQKFMLAIGYNHQRRQEMKTNIRNGITGFSWGICINTNKIMLAFSRANYHIAGQANNISLQINFNQFYKKK